MTQITVCDVAPRDGLQNDPTHLSPATRAELVNRLVDAGRDATSRWRRSSTPSACRRWPAPRRSWRAIDRRPGVTYSGLILNARGYDRLAALRPGRGAHGVAASETLNQRNQNATVEESLADVQQIISRAHERGAPRPRCRRRRVRLPVRGRGGPRARAGVAELAVERRRRRDRLCRHHRRRRARPRCASWWAAGASSGVPIGVHLHDTRGTGLANAYAALESGVSALDASAGGVGGCPFAPGATGNIATEDLVYLLHGEGVSTGIDLDALIEVSHWLAEQLGHDIPGRVQRAGDFTAVSRRTLGAGAAATRTETRRGDTGMAYRLGVDVGGTFTDVLVLEEDKGTLTLEKVLSTPEDQSIGVLEGVRQACQRLGVQLSDLDAILHGSTVVTNLILESKGATGGLLTTQGHEQLLHLARAWTPGPLYGWMGMIKPPPMVELWRTRTVSARMSAGGEVVREFDEAEVRAALEELVAAGAAVADHRLPELLRQPRARAPRPRHRARTPSRTCRSRSPPIWSPSTASTSARSPRCSTPTPSRR